MGDGVEVRSSFALQKILRLIGDEDRDYRSRDVLRRNGLVDGFVIVAGILLFLGIVVIDLLVGVLSRLDMIRRNRMAIFRITTCLKCLEETVDEMDCRLAVFEAAVDVLIDGGRAIKVTVDHF